MNKKDKNILIFIKFLMFIISVVTIYFCLDVFGIIKVPEKYSIASLFYSQIEVMATSGKIITEDIIPKNEIIFDDNKEKIENRTIIFEEEPKNNETKLDQLIEDKNDIPNDNDGENYIENNNIINDLADCFYYNQLDEYGKIIYEELYNNIDKLKTGNYIAEFDTRFDDLLHQEDGFDTLRNSFQLAINSLTFDNPFLFYIDITKINLITETTTKAFSKVYRVSIGGNGNSYLSDDFYTEDDVENAINNINQIKTEIINTARTKTDNIVEQAKIVHDYLVDNVEYDVTAGRNVYNLYGALIERRAVCEGYARAYKDILNQMGIPCIIVCGIGQNSSGLTESHAWNYVKIDETWYAVDVTWDDPIISGNGRLTDEHRYSYFLVGSEKFFRDHQEDGNLVGEYKFLYPEISDVNY